MNGRLFLNFTAAALLFAIAAPRSGLAQQQSLDGAYTGTLVCEHLPGTRGILRAPLDIVVANGAVVAARPVFNFNGSRVVGTEIATGTMSADGAVHLASSWFADGTGFKATYNGTLSPTGGMVAGTQTWTRPPSGGGDASRTCFGAFVRSRTPE